MREETSCAPPGHTVALLDEPIFQRDMSRNRSFPPGTVIPELAYADVIAASAWLCEAFGLRERLRIGTHRVQLVFGDAAIVAIEGGVGDEGATHGILVRVDNADAHHEHAKRAGARIL